MHQDAQDGAAGSTDARPPVVDKGVGRGSVLAPAMIALAEAEDDLVCLADGEGRLLWVNAAWESILGLDRHSLVNTPWIALVHPDDHAGTLAGGSRLIAEGRVHGLDNRYRRADGIYVRLRWSGVHLPEHRVALCRGRLIDAGEEAERLARHRRDVLLAALGAAQDGAAEVQRIGEHWVLSDAARRALGLPSHGAVRDRDFETVLDRASWVGLSTTLSTSARGVTRIALVLRTGTRLDLLLSVDTETDQRVGLILPAPAAAAGDASDTGNWLAALASTVAQIDQPVFLDLVERPGYVMLNPAAGRLFDGAWDATDCRWVARSALVTGLQVAGAALAGRRLLADVDAAERIHPGTDVLHVHRAGRPRVDLVGRGVPLRKSDGQLAGVLSVYVDISLLNDSQRDVEDLQLRLRLALSSADLGVWTWWPESGRIEIDRMAATILGVGDALPDGPIHVADLLRAYPGPTRRRLMRAALRNLRRPGGPARRVELAPPHASRWRVIELGGVPDRWEPGNQSRIVGVVRDITETARAERQLERARALLDAAQDAASVGGWSLDRTTGRLRWTHQAYALHEVSRDDFVPSRQSWGALFDLPNRSRLHEMLDGSTDGPRTIELHRRRQDRSVQWLQMSVQARNDGALVGAVQDISARKAIEIALRQSERRWRFALEGVGDGVWILNVASGRLTVSPNWSNLLGRPGVAAPRSRMELEALIHPDDRPGFSLQLDEFVTGRAAGFGCEARLQTGSGAWAWTNTRAAVTDRGPRGTPVEVVAVTQDVTRRRDAESALVRSRERFRGLVDSADAIFHERDPATGSFSYVSAKAAQLLGYPVEEWYRDGFWVSRLHPDDRDLAARLVCDALGTGESRRVEYRLVRADGEVVWVDDRITAARDPDGSQHLRGVMIDVSARKEAESRESAQLAVMTAIATGAAVDEVLSTVARSAEEQMRGARVTVALLDDSMQGLAIGSGVDDAEPSGGAVRVLPLRFGLHPAVEALLSRRAIVVEDFDAPSPWQAALATMRADGVESVVFVPIVGRENVALGTLVATWKRSRPIGAREMLTLELSARHAAIALEKRRAEESLRESRNRLSEVFDAMVEGCLVFDARGNITSANPAAAGIFRMHIDELLGTAGGRRWSVVRDDGSVMPVEDEPISRALNHGHVVRDQALRMVDAEGNTLAVSVNVTPITAADGTVLGAVATVNDITERMRLQAEIEHRSRELEDRTQEALRLAQAKSTFLANMSHEIRTPLAAIVGHTDRALRGQGDAVVSASLGHIRSGAEHLLAIVNNVLDATQIESGEVAIAHEPYSPRTLVEEVVAMFEAAAEAKGLTLRHGTGSDVPVEVVGDALRTRQVLINLVSNALKFTAAGGRIQVDVDVTGPSLRWCVTDTGIGLDAKEISRLFQPFGQVDESAARRYGGTGLGLYISERLVVAMGGAMSVSSEPGAGSSFSMLLPMTLPVAKAPLARDGSVDVPQVLPRSRILLADDDPILRELVVEMLEDLGMQVDAVVNGVDAVAAAVLRNYDCILMDMHMPEMDGRTAVGEIRRSGYAGPILAITADVVPESQQGHITAGCDRVLTKPIRSATLASVLASFLTPGTARGRGRANPARLSRIGERFANTVPGEISALDDEWRRRDRTAIAERAHRLKGTSGFLGLAQLREAMIMVETAATSGADDELGKAVEAAVELLRRAGPPVDEGTQQDR